MAAGRAEKKRWRSAAERNETRRVRVQVQSLNAGEAQAGWHRSESQQVQYKASNTLCSCVCASLERVRASRLEERGGDWRRARRAREG